MCETNTDDNGNGHMDAVNLGTECYFSPCTGSGPWVEADMENGLFSGGNGSNTANAGNGTNFVTAMLKMVSGYPSDATDNAVQANITSVGYSGASNGGTPPAGTIAGPGGRCVDVLGDDSGTDHAAVDLWNCQPTAIDQHWTHNSDDSLSTLGRCLDIVGNGTAVGTKVQLYDCDGVGGQVTR